MAMRDEAPAYTASPSHAVLTIETERRRLAHNESHEEPMFTGRRISSRHRWRSTVALAVAAATIVGAVLFALWALNLEAWTQ